MLSVNMLNVVMLNVIMLSVVTLSLVAPDCFIRVTDAFTASQKRNWLIIAKTVDSLKSYLIL
jgi:hypothetical protein